MSHFAGQCPVRPNFFTVDPGRCTNTKIEICHVPRDIWWQFYRNTSSQGYKVAGAARSYLRWPFQCADTAASDCGRRLQPVAVASRKWYFLYLSVNTMAPPVQRRGAQALFEHLKKGSIVVWGLADRRRQWKTSPFFYMYIVRCLSAGLKKSVTFECFF